MDKPWEHVLSLEEIADIKSLSLRLRLGDDLLMNPDRTGDWDGARLYLLHTEAQS